MAKKEKKLITEERLREFQYYLKKNEKSGATIQKYMLALRRLMDYLGGEELRKEKMLDYRDYLKSHMKAQTVNGALSAIDSFLNYANWQDCKISFLKVQRQFFLNEARELSEDEYRRLLRTAKNKGDERLYMLMMTICGTGIRISELPYVTVSAVQFGRVEIELKRKWRTIIFQKELQKKLLGYIKKTGIKDGPVFCTRKGKPLDRSNICRDMLLAYK